MRGKLMLVTGLAVGYVLGSRAGRGRYEQISRAAESLWNSSPVQHQVHNVEDFAKDKAPEVVDFVSGNVKKMVGRKSSKSNSRGNSTGASHGTTPASTPGE